VRDAADIGYRVRLFPDCCVSGDMDAHRATLRTMPMLADVMESQEALPG
jgi:nicotinamidase-related amidase